jgi:hypothetical protein
VRGEVERGGAPLAADVRVQDLQGGEAGGGRGGWAAAWLAVWLAAWQIEGESGLLPACLSACRLLTSGLRLCVTSVPLHRN